jgi:hypothetical protein
MTSEFPKHVRAPCALCREPLPEQFGGAYDGLDPSLGGARVYCCPTCIRRLGWKRALNRALSMLRSWQRNEVAP